MNILAARLFLPGDRAPDAAVALRDADIGDAIGHPPVPGRVGGQRRSNTCGQKESGKNYSAREGSWAVQHGSDLCFSDDPTRAKRRIERFQLTKWPSTEVSSEC